MVKLKRRDFVKLGVTAGVAAAGGLSLRGYGVAYLENTEPEQYRHGMAVGTVQSRKLREVIASTCLGCNGGCGIIGYVEDRRLVKIEGNPEHPYNRGKICARGLDMLSALYDPDRVLYPMRRVGQRGEGKWERITWEEALSEVAEKLRELKARERGKEVVFHYGNNRKEKFVQRFCSAYGTPHTFNHEYIGTKSKRMALQLTLGSPAEFVDLANTRYVLNFGVNIFEAYTTIGSAIDLTNSRVKNRAKLVTFDPRLSDTAGRSDEWIPIFPGTDGVVALAMANVIMREELYDKEFMSRWSNYSAEKLARHLMRYTPQEAEEISGVRAEDIERLAREFASTKPAMALVHKGACSHHGGVHTARAVILLNAITGNIGVKGSAGIAETLEAELEPGPKILANPIQDGFPFQMIKEGKLKTSVYILHHHNPVYSCPDSKSVEEVLKSEKLVPYFVAIDTHVTESSKFADLLLPEACFLERLEIDGVNAYDVSTTRSKFVSLRQPVVKPLGETRQLEEMLIDLAENLGLKYFEFTQDGYVHEIASSLGIPFEALREKGVVEYGSMRERVYEEALTPEELEDSEEDELGLVYKDGKPIGMRIGDSVMRGFSTPSRKIEVYSSELEKRGFAPLPVYERGREFQDLRDGEFVLITFKWNVHTNSRTASSAYLHEIAHTNHMWINKKAADAIGVKTGDEVRVTSEMGSIVTKAFVMQGIHPRCVAISGGLGHWGFGRIAKAESQRDERSGLLSTDFGEESPGLESFRRVKGYNYTHFWWSTNGVHPNPIIPIKLDPVSGSQVWATRVRVEKV